MRFVVGCWLVVALAACPSDDQKNCTVGDLTLAPTIDLHYVGVDGTSKVMQPMDNVPLEQPIQGGYVFYVEPHLHNMEACSVQLTTKLTDTSDNSVVVFESRTSIFVPDTTGGAVTINSENDGLVAACPQSQLTRSINDNTYLLTVTAVDPQNRMATASIEVVPTCADSFCKCQCSTTYKLGDTCQ